MKFINQSVEFIPHSLDVKKNIEIAGRTCYKSEDKITKDSSEKFYNAMRKNNHTAMLEHGIVIMEIPYEQAKSILGRKNYDSLCGNPYINVTGLYKWCESENENLVISGNVRALLNTRLGCGAEIIYPALDKLGLLNKGGYKILDYLQIPDYKFYTVPEFSISDYNILVQRAHSYYTMRFITDRGVSHELVRHRTFSFAQESTRYCNYSKDKFNKGLTFIKPYWYDSVDEYATFGFLYNCYSAERWYKDMVSVGGLSPEGARDMLPSCLKTEIVVTGNYYSWEHFFDLRYYEKTGKAHPQMKALATLAYNCFRENRVEF